MGKSKMLDELPIILTLEALSGASDAVENAGGMALSVSPSNIKKVSEVVEAGGFHGVLLTGGGDVNPRLYHRKPHARVYGVSETRDATETFVLTEARRRGLPVLGICRGMQIQNVEAGGTMNQHIPGHSGTSHPVLSTKDSTFLRAVGGRWSVDVTSLHHQEIGTVGRGYRITGRAPDGTVEAIESVDGRCLGVQFHPEMDQEDEYARDIFRWLIEESATRAGMPIPRRPKYIPSPYLPYEYGNYRGSYWKQEASRKAVETRRKNQQAALKAAQDAAGTTVAFCPHDGTEFDFVTDWIDHMWEVHNEFIPSSYVEEYGAGVESSAWSLYDGSGDDMPSGIDRLTNEDWKRALEEAAK